MHPAQRISNPLIHYGILALIYGIGMVTLLSHTVFHHMHMHHSETYISAAPVAAVAGTCTTSAAHHYQLSFTSHGIVPDTINAQRCDELTLMNNTDGEIIPAFGPHEHHTHYPGFKETVLLSDQQYSFRLAESGTFPLHDHDDDSLRATLEVK